MLKNKRGITLIALIITIIVLLLLAGITISSLTGSGLFGKTQEAEQKQENAQILENSILSEYENIINNYVSGTGTGENGETTSVTLASVVNVGDYVEYTPDTVTTETHNALISEIGTYSGNTDTSYNTSSTIKQESLNWRVLDIVEDENGNDCVRLISEVPTTSTVRLYGAKGYNNAVYLLDKTCNTLYNNSKYAKNVQSLKIEDIQKYLTYDYTTYPNSYVNTEKYNGTKTYTSSSYRYYPNLFEKEKTGWVNGVQGTELGLSEQTIPINETSTKAGTSIKITQTYWTKTLSETDFKNEKYYNLFIKNGANNYSTYWISSRCVLAYENNACFCVPYMRSDNALVASGLFLSRNDSNGDVFAFRAVITLNADVMVDTEKSGDGSEVTKEYILK